MGYFDNPKCPHCILRMEYDSIGARYFCPFGCEATERRRRSEAGQIRGSIREAIEQDAERAREKAFVWDTMRQIQENESNRLNGTEE